MRVYVGYDPKDELAFRACVSSLQENTSIPLDIYPLKECELRRQGLYMRSYRKLWNGQMIDDADGKPFSTEFSFTRFLIPEIDKSDDWALFCDADFLFLDDVAKLLALADASKHVMCVQHAYAPTEISKMDGVQQQQYKCKNWSSMMLLRPGMIELNKQTVSSAPGGWLHAFGFEKADNIGALPAAWNWLEGHSPDNVEISALHYTRGTPDMLGDHLPHSAAWWHAVKKWTPEMNHVNLFPCVS